MLINILQNKKSMCHVLCVVYIRIYLYKCFIAAGSSQLAADNDNHVIEYQSTPADTLAADSETQR